MRARPPPPKADHHLTHKVYNKLWHIAHGNGSRIVTKVHPEDQPILPEDKSGKGATRDEQPRIFDCWTGETLKHYHYDSKHEADPDEGSSSTPCSLAHYPCPTRWDKRAGQECYITDCWTGSTSTHDLQLMQGSNAPTTHGEEPGNNGNRGACKRRNRVRHVTWDDWPEKECYIDHRDEQPCTFDRGETPEHHYYDGEPGTGPDKGGCPAPCSLAHHTCDARWSERTGQECYIADCDERSYCTSYREDPSNWHCSEAKTEQGEVIDCLGSGHPHGAACYAACQAAGVDTAAVLVTITKGDAECGACLDRRRKLSSAKA